MTHELNKRRLKKAGCVRSGNLNRDQLKRVVAHVDHILTTRGDITRAFESENKMMLATMKKLPDDTDQRQQLMMMMGAWDEENFKTKIEEFEKQSVAISALHAEYLQAPYWSVDKKGYQRRLDELIARSHPLFKIAIPNYTEAKVRFLVAEAKLKIVLQEAAIEWHKLDAGHYPESAGVLPHVDNDLVPAYLNEAPVDPFSGGPLAYALVISRDDESIDRASKGWRMGDGSEADFITTMDVSTFAYDVERNAFHGDWPALSFFLNTSDIAELDWSYEVRSVGPDKNNSVAGAEIYNPTNGTVSAGNLVFE